MGLEVEGGATRNDRIESWGEIANYLRRDIKTVQRWERKSGMPVHRLVAGRGRPSVYAYRSEIDEWLVGASLTDSGSTRPLPQGVAEDSLEESRPSRRLWLLGAVVAAVAVFVLAGGRNSPETGRADPITSRPLTHYPGHEINPAISPDGRQVAFSWDGDLYVQFIDGGEPLRLTDTPESEAGPVWSPDGTRIAFLRWRPFGTDGEILTVTALGGTPQTVVKTKLAGPRSTGIAWSPDGEHLAFVAPEVSQSGVSLFSFSDRSIRPLTKPTSPSAFPEDRYPAFSPDGQRVVVTRFRAGPPRAVVVGLDGEELQSFVTEAGNRHAWSADGESLIFARRGGGAGKLRRLWLADGRVENIPSGGAEASEPHVRGHLLAFTRWRFDSNLRSFELSGDGTVEGEERILAAATSREHSPVFSPDGRRLVFMSDRSGVNEVWTSDRDGGSLKQITFRNEPETGSPRWSPDGRWIAFDSKPGAETPVGVFVVNAQGGEPRLLTPRGIDARVPCWSRDGQWIYFLAGDGVDPAGIWKIPKEGGDPILVVAGGYEPVASADGRMLYYSLPRPTAGLWSLDLATGAKREIISDGGFYRYWAAANEAIYYVRGRERNESMRPFEIRRFDVGTRESTTVATLDHSLMEGPSGLAVTPDESRLVITTVDLNDRDIVLVEGIQ